MSIKYHLADLLTLTRFFLAVALLALAFTGGDLAVGFLLFVLGELTDAFDGTCATRWPFPRGHVPWYRRYAAKYDMLTDMLLAVAMILFFIFRVNFIAGWAIGIGYSLIAIIVDLIAYGKIMGHPDDFAPRSLSARNFPLAKRLVLSRRMLYLALIALVATWTFYASTCPLALKIVITIIAAAVSAFLWFFLAQRRHNISRDAVRIEQKLSRKK